MASRRGYAEISAFAHATEDLDKVKLAVLRVLPEELADRVRFCEYAMTGHNDNLIVELRVELHSRADAYQALQAILVGISLLEQTALEDEFSKHLDERKRLFLRLDKQKAFQGEAVLASVDAISFTFRLPSRPKSLRQLKEDLATYTEYGRRGWS
jgi:RNA binding exosome subunit